MNVETTKAFLKQLKKLNNALINEEVKMAIENIVNSSSLTEVKNLKKLSGYTNYYRIRIGDYRIGIYFHDSIVWLAAIANRKDIYKYFP